VPNVWCPMQPNNSPYEVSAWVLTRERIGQSLRERYQVAKELPRSLLTVVKKLDAVEGNLLLRRIQEAPGGRRKTPTAN
jgi:hypothetical protein